MDKHCKQCPQILNKPRKGQDFCSGACRAAYWRTNHVTRCPNCGVPITVTIASAAHRTDSAGV